ncbi:MAG: T9SS type A sorting domain-containing protein [Saprospiraceae bacterium]|nr:T9SS type A sorting domain-containing protein [Saprospiraceae bacterium]
MKCIYTFGLVLAVSLLTAGIGLRAQSCEFTLELSDSFGDGWNGASISVIVNGNETVYTLDGINDNGSFESVSFSVMDGDTIQFFYTPGLFDIEVSYALFNPEGRLVFSDGPLPTAGLVFTAFAVCPSCPLPDINTIEAEDIRHDRVDISWEPSDPDAVHLIEFGLADFEPGLGEVVETTGGSVRLEGLSEKTVYDFYLSVACENGDTSDVAGPFSFETRFAVNVGLINILTPTTACALGSAEAVTITLQNFGGKPQSLIPFRYSVNGEDAGVNIPFDGFYTGVLGTDSTVTIEFEKTFDFSEPGEYEISAWTELEDDSELENDTSTVLITHIPLISELPYFEDFEEWGGGWTVDSLSNSPSWEHGKPDGSVIATAAGGQNAWVTNLDGKYNDSELSYLLSPCFDFSNLTEDPRLSFALNVNTESCCDEVWVEFSIDSGETWGRVGRPNTGTNWFNDEGNNWWDGDGGSDGWVLASNELTGTAGAKDVRIRFVFSSDISVSREGVGIDNIGISLPQANDLAALSVENTSREECGEQNDRISLTIGNLGTESQSGFDLAYRVNGGEVVVENTEDLTLAPGEEASYTFNTPFNSADAPTSTIEAWTLLPDDGFTPNDTASFTFFAVRSIPLLEDFEQAILPSGWSASDDAVITDGHNNESVVLAYNLFEDQANFEATTPVVGPVQRDDSLFFDYRYVDFLSGGTEPKQLGSEDNLRIEISTDCGASYNEVFRIERANHVTSTELATVGIPLSVFEGEDIKVRFNARWGSGDYWLDLDNINIRRCPASLGLTVETSEETETGAKDGQATVIPTDGSAPYTYEWSSGDSTKTAVSLEAGDYRVTVTDQFGCSDIISFTLGVSTAIEEIDQIEYISLAPNPSSGVSRLIVRFSEGVDLQIQMFNLVGQVIWEDRFGNVMDAVYELDLSDQPSGLYFIRMAVDGKIKTVKLIRSR